MRYLLFSFLLLTACTTESVKDTEITAAEVNYKADESPENALKLITSYVNFVNKNKDGDKVANAKALEDAIVLAEKHKMKGQAMNMMHIYVRDFNDQANVADYLVSMSNNFREADRKVVADALLIGLKKRFPDHAEAKNAPNAELSVLIDRSAENIFDDSLKVVRRNVAAQYVDLCEIHALTLPSDPQSAKYLHKAAETARTMRHTKKALNIYDWILTKYENDPMAPQALFLKAYTLDDMLNNEKDAEPLYRELLAKYPDSDFADDAEFQLENLGKSDEEVLQEILKRAEEKQQNQ